MGEKVVSPSCSSTILAPPPPNYTILTIHVRCRAPHSPAPPQGGLKVPSTHLPKQGSLPVKSRLRIPDPQPRGALLLLPVSASTALGTARGVVQYLSFFMWLISLGITSSRFIHVVARVRISFLLWAGPYFTVCMDHVCLSTIRQRPLALLPPLNHCEGCCCEQGVQIIAPGPAFNFSHSSLILH